MAYTNYRLYVFHCKIKLIRSVHFHNPSYASLKGTKCDLLESNGFSTTEASSAEDELYSG